MAETAQQRNARLKREADERETRRRESDAKARQAEADAAARKAEAEARATEARLRDQAAARQAEERRRKDENAPYDQARSAAINLSAMAVGMGGGTLMARNLTKKREAAVVAANKEMKRLGSRAEKLMSPAPKTPPAAGAVAPVAKVSKAKLAGVVASADRLNLLQRPRALGLATAGILVAEGAFARFVVAPKLEGASAEAVGSIATASVVAGATLVGKRFAANATSPNAPPATAVAQIEAARKVAGDSAVSKAAARQAAQSPTLVQRAVAAVQAIPKSKAATVAAVATGAGTALVLSATSAKSDPGADKPASPTGKTIEAVGKSAEVGLSTAASIQAAKFVASPAVRATAGVLTKLAVPLTVGMAVVGAVRGYQEGGVKGAAMGGADSVTGGLASMAVDWAKGKGGGEAGPAPVTAAQAEIASGRLAMMQDAAGRSAAEMGQTTTLAGSGTGAAALPLSDGQTEGYYRQQHGKRVFVQGYQTPGR